MIFGMLWANDSDVDVGLAQFRPVHGYKLPIMSPERNGRWLQHRDRDGSCLQGRGNPSPAQLSDWPLAGPGVTQRAVHRDPDAGDPG